MLKYLKLFFNNIIVYNDIDYKRLYENQQK